MGNRELGIGNGELRIGNGEQKRKKHKFSLQMLLTFYPTCLFLQLDGI